MSASWISTRPLISEVNSDVFLRMASNKVHSEHDGSEYATVRSHAVQLMSSGSNACWLGCSNAAAITGITRGTSIKLHSSITITRSNESRSG